MVPETVKRVKHKLRGTVPGEYVRLEMVSIFAGSGGCVGVTWEGSVLSFL
jgi:hypothetical protein